MARKRQHQKPGKEGRAYKKWLTCLHSWDAHGVDVRNLRPDDPKLLAQECINCGVTIKQHIEWSNQRTGLDMSAFDGSVFFDQRTAPGS